MRGLLAWCTSLALMTAVGFTLLAGPVPGPTPAGTQTADGSTLRAEALNYAHLILETVSHIQIDYYRPVSRVELVEAALVGLFEAARQPFPPALQSDFRRLKEDPLKAEDELLGLLVRTREQLGNHEALRGPSAVRASLQTLPRALDSYSGLIGPQDTPYLEVTEHVSSAGLEFVGVAPPPPPIGLGAGGGILPGDVVVADGRGGPAGPTRIRNVIPGGPAQRAGLRPGDLIVKLDGHPPESPDFAKLLRRLLPPQSGRGTASIPGLPAAIQLTVLRPGRTEPWEVALAPAPFRPESVFGVRRRPDGSWDFLLDSRDRIGYIRIGAISQYNTLPAFQEALRSLRSQSVRGLVLDLRWSPIGYLIQSATIAKLLLPEGAPIAFQQARHQPVTPVDTEQANDSPHLDYPVVVLVSGETSGGGELVAAALQDNGRAMIAGQRTVGKGSVQKPLQALEPYGIKFKATSATLSRPSGKNLQRSPGSKATDEWGVRPDAGRELTLTAESSQQLKEWWMLYELRPTNSTEALPLDDPENDPQRQAAVQMVREMIKKTK